jgi:two-component system response regulator HydG
MGKADKKIRILVVDDEPEHAQVVAESLERIGFSCSVATSGEEALAELRKNAFAAVVTDLVMEEPDGMAVLKAAKDADETIQVILISAYGNVENAVQAMEKGAYSFLTKPINVEELRAKVKKAVHKHELLREKAELGKRLDKKFGLENIIGDSQPMQKVFETISQVAETDVTVLITGESGTGKELVARAIHQNSPRKRYPFVALNCAALSEGLLESELFGHEKGAFTGAVASREGKFEYADGGTLLLDEIGDMPPPTQAKLLRVIEDGEVVRLGSNKPIKVDVRIISSTNTSLDEKINKGQFRDDLYFRIRVVSINIPPLRERREDIPLLVDHFLKELSATHNRTSPAVTSQAMDVLSAYAWRGNVRELRNCLESMLVTTSKDSLDVDDIPAYIRGKGEVVIAPKLLPGMSLEEAEKELIKTTLAKTNGNREEAAKILGIGERTLYRKLKLYDLS